jgi:ferredoxin
VKIVIDSERCQGHNRCYAIAPELIDVDDLGTAFVIGDGTISTELAEKARLTVANCPERAITLTD